MFKSSDGRIVADLNQDGAIFIAARGGAGGKGNHFFATDTNQAPEVAEYGAEGEIFTYVVEMRTIAHVGLVSLSTFHSTFFYIIMIFFFFFLLSRLGCQMLVNLLF